MTLERYPDGRLLETQCKTPFGLKKTQGRMTVHREGAVPRGVKARDDFRATPAEGGTRLHVKSTFYP